MNTSFKKTLVTLQTFSKYSQLRKFSKTTVIRNLAVPAPDGQPKTYSPKIEELATSISKLNLIEVAELTDLLKKKLNLPDMPAMGFAPVAAQPKAAEEEEESSSMKQTSFSVKLKAFDEKQKVTIIKEIKNIIEGMNLVQAKKFIESAPAIVKENIGKDEAEAIKAQLTKAGGDVEII